MSLKCRLGLLLVSFEQLGERDLVPALSQHLVFEDASGQAHVIVGVDVDGEVEEFAQLFLAENEISLYDDHLLRLDFVRLLSPDLLEPIVNRLVEGLQLVLKLLDAVDEQVPVYVLWVVEVNFLSQFLILLNNCGVIGQVLNC